MKRFEDNRSNKKLGGMKLCPRIFVKLDVMKRNSRLCVLHYAGHYVFKIEDDEDSYDVNLRDVACTCNKWPWTRLPCWHAIVVVQHINPLSSLYLVHLCENL